MNMSLREKSKEIMESFMCSNILACDIGLKRIGIALYCNHIILPLQPILRKNRKQASQAFKTLLEEKQIHTLIVGIPKSELNEEEHTMERRIKHFISLVDFKGQIIYVDESYSSIEAQERLFLLKKKERSEKIKNGELDSLAAMIILERYLLNPTL